MVKKIILVIMAGILTFSLVACGSNDSEKEQPASAEETTDANEEEEKGSAEAQEPQSSAETEGTQAESSGSGNALVVYFSWSGNTKSVAEEIQAQTGADIFEIIPEQSYTEDYNELLDVAQEEQREDARPAIKGSIEEIGNYEIVYLGFPNWWGDMPMIVYSFLDDYDLSGKTVAPFCTSGGSGFSDSIATIKSMEPDANVLDDGLHIGDSSAGDPQEAVTEWLSQIEMN